MQRAEEILPGRVGIAAAKFGLIRIRDRVNDEIQSIPSLGKSREDLIQMLGVADIASQHGFAANRLGKRLDAFSKGVILVGERELGAMCGQVPGDPPSDGMIIGNTKHQTAFARHQISSVQRHR